MGASEIFGLHNITSPSNKDCGFSEWSSVALILDLEYEVIENYSKLSEDECTIPEDLPGISVQLEDLPRLKHLIQGYPRRMNS